MCMLLQFSPIESHLEPGGDHVSLGLDGGVAGPYDGSLVQLQEHLLLALAETRDVMGVFRGRA